MLRLNVRGMELLPDQRLAPDAILSRASYAMVFEDILSTIAHDPVLSVRHLGTPSPFADVPDDAPYFNAVMVCCGRGLLAATDIRSGKFDPAGPVPGVDVLLMIRKLKEELRLF